MALKNSLIFSSLMRFICYQYARLTLPFFALLMSLFLNSNQSFAEKPKSADCVDCGGKLSSSIMPDISVAMELKKDLATPNSVARGLSSDKPMELAVKKYIDGCNIKQYEKECYIKTMCNKFYLAKDRWDVEEMFEMIPNFPVYNKVDYYFFMVECSPLEYNQNNGIKAPMIHLIVDDIGKRHEYLEAIFDMYDLNGEGSKLTQILNLKSTEQDTFLDYLYYQMKERKNAIPVEGRSLYEKVFKYACEKGAVFNKYKNIAKCGQPLYGQWDK